MNIIQTFETASQHRVYTTSLNQNQPGLAVQNEAALEANKKLEAQLAEQLLQCQQRQGQALPCLYIVSFLALESCRFCWWRHQKTWTRPQQMSCQLNRLPKKPSCVAFLWRSVKPLEAGKAVAVVQAKRS